MELRFANGKVYVAVTTDWNGVFSLVPDVAAPNEVLYLVELSGLVYGNLTLDSIGAGNIDVPLPPPSIHADVFYDTNGDGILNGDDMPYGSKPVQIRGPNGTILGNLMTNSMGNINGTIAALFPGQPIQIIDPLTGAVLGTGTTDSKGNILVTVALRLTMSLTSTKPLAPIPTSAVPTTPSAPTPTSAVPTNPPAVATSTSTPSNNPPVAVPTTTLVPVPSAVPTSMAPTAAVTTDVAFSTVTPPPLPATSAAPLPVTPAPPSTTIVVTSMMMPTPTTTPTATQSATQSTTQSTTWSATSTSATQTSTSATQTLPPPVVGGTVFVDINKDGAFTPGVDQLFANETVALYFSNGSFYSYAITLPNGTFSMADLIPAPNEILTVVLALDPASAAGTITTDAFGNGVTNVALPPPIIAGNLFVDMNSDGGLNDGDVPLGLETVVLLFPNGSVYANMVTSPNGAFTLDPALPIAPYQNLVMIRASSPTSPVANLVTDFRGGAEIDVPLPAPAITGQLWIGVYQMACSASFYMLTSFAPSHRFGS